MGKATKAKVEDVMVGPPVMIDATAPVSEAARQMKAQDIGDVIVMRDGQICGMVTDRDIVVRVVAEGRDEDQTKLGDICSREPVTIKRSAGVEDAVQLMREHAIRRLPVVEDGQPVGIVSLGDLAQNRDPGSVLADISGAPANA